MIVTLFFITPSIKSNELVVEIDNPKFSEKSLDDRIYEIKASKGLKSDNELELFIIEGKFKAEKNGKWIYLEADKGKFSQMKKYIELEKNIFFYTDEGEELRSTFATFDMENDIIELSKNVSHKNFNGKVFSDISIITDSFNKISYKGNVISVIENKSK